MKVNVNVEGKGRKRERRGDEGRGGGNGKVGVLDDAHMRALKRHAEMEMSRKVVEEGRKAKVEIGRFDYGSIHSLERGVEGFCVSCAMRRERSATQEAASLCEGAKGGLGGGGGVDVPCSQYNIVKVSARGLVVMGLKEKSSIGRDVLDVVEWIYEKVGNGEIGLPKHVVRIMPIHVTCTVERAAIVEAGKCLGAKALRLVPSLKEAPRFAISLSSGHHHQVQEEGLGTTAIISILAEAFAHVLQKHVCANIKVDLTNPTARICVKHIDVMGRSFLILGLVSKNLSTSKGKFGIKSLKSTGDN